MRGARARACSYTRRRDSEIKLMAYTVLNDTPVQFSFYYFPVSDLTFTKQLKASYLKTGVKKMVEAAKQ